MPTCSLALAGRAVVPKACSAFLAAEQRAAGVPSACVTGPSDCRPGCCGAAAGPCGIGVCLCVCACRKGTGRPACTVLGALLALSSLAGWQRPTVWPWSWARLMGGKGLQSSSVLSTPSLCCVADLTIAVCFCLLACSPAICLYLTHSPIAACWMPWAVIAATLLQRQADNARGQAWLGHLHAVVLQGEDGLLTHHTHILTRARVCLCVHVCGGPPQHPGGAASILAVPVAWICCC